MTDFVARRQAALRAEPEPWGRPAVDADGRNPNEDLAALIRDLDDEVTVGAVEMTADDWLHWTDEGNAAFRSLLAQIETGEDDKASAPPS